MSMKMLIMVQREYSLALKVKILVCNVISLKCYNTDVGYNCTLLTVYV